jgi:hypothetical protein
VPSSGARCATDGRLRLRPYAAGIRVRPVRSLADQRRMRVPAQTVTLQRELLLLAMNNDSGG